MGELKLNLPKYKVLTPDGFKEFAGISYMGDREIIKVILENGLFLECTEDHKFFISDLGRIPLSQLSEGHEILTSEGFSAIKEIRRTGRIEEVYDLIEVDGGHRYFTNGILSSNCQFISFSETLISASKLTALSGTGLEPLHKTGQIRWYDKVRDGRTYVVALDPSMGTGGDNAAIEVVELPSMRQVAEWQHNRSIIEDQVKTLRAILLEIQDQAPKSEIYWTVESNSLGEAALVVIRDTGEERFPGTFMHDPNRHLGTKNKRKGYLTTNTTKLEACAKLKTLVEQDKLIIRSKNLIHELKYYIAAGNSYRAAVGETDDLISAMLVIIRMVQHISTWDDSLHDRINSNVGGMFEEDYEAPLPLII